MKSLLALLACTLLLLGCSKSNSSSNSNIAFTAGTSREVIVKQLAQLKATILKDSPNLLHAEFTTRQLKRPMQVELGFADGKLNSVNYIPQ